MRNVKIKEEKNFVRCKACGYMWNTKSRHVYVTCPSCLAKVQIREKKKRG